MVNDFPHWQVYRLEVRLTTGFAAPDFGDEGTELAGVWVAVGEASSVTGTAELRTGEELTEQVPFDDKEEKKLPSGTGRSFSSGGRLKFGGVRGEYKDAKELSELEEDEADSIESCRET